MKAEASKKQQQQGAELFSSSTDYKIPSDPRFAPENKPKEVKEEPQTESSTDPQYYTSLEKKYYPENYVCYKVVLAKGKGSELWDVAGKRYIDFTSAYCTVNQGHCHPKIIKALTDQAQKLTITSKYLNNIKGPFEELLCKTFQYSKILFMNSGAEAVETAIKLARRWAYEKKKVPENEATILFAQNHYHGLLLGTTAASDEKLYKNNFGPHDCSKFEHVPFDNIPALEAMFKSNTSIAAFIVEPVQGKGLQYAEPGYFKGVRELCDQYNVLFICDEIQMGLGRCGKLLAVDWDEVKPDMITLGKPLSGGFYPLSCVMGNDEVMLNLKPGEHFTTYEGNPLACAIGKAAIEVLFEEKLIENSEKLGVYLYQQLESLKSNAITEIRGGKGLLAGIILNNKLKENIPEIVDKLIENGLIVSPIQEDNRGLRFAPPLMITKELIDEAIQILKKVLDSYN